MPVAITFLIGIQLQNTYAGWLDRSAGGRTNVLPNGKDADLPFHFKTKITYYY